MSVNANRILKDYFGEPLANSFSVDYLVITDFTDSFLNVKYKYKVTEEESDDSEEPKENFELFENKTYFPIMYKITQNDRFEESKIIIENQNNLYKYLSNSNDNLFERTDEYTIEDCSLEDGYLVRLAEGYCTFKPTKEDGKNYVEIDSDSFKIIPSYDTLTTSDSYGTHMTFDMSEKSMIFIIEEKVEVDFVGSYKMDEDKLLELSNTLNANKVNITSHNQSSITGNIVNDLDDQIIFTSIPYDNGWHVKINGEEVKTFKNLDAFLAFNLPKGESNIELYFIPQGFVLGLTISLLTFDILVAIYVRKNKED